MAADDDDVPLTELAMGEEGRSSGTAAASSGLDLALVAGTLEGSPAVSAEQAERDEFLEHLDSLSVQNRQEDDRGSVDSGAEKDWYRSALSPFKGTASSGSFSGVHEQSAASSWDVVPPPVASAPRRVDRAVAAAYQSLEGTSTKHVWEDDFWGNLFSAVPEEPFKGFYGTGLKRPLQPDLPVATVEPVSAKPRQVEMSSLRFFEMSVVKRRAVTWKQMRAEQLTEAVGCWAVFISRWEAGVQIRDQLCGLLTEDERKAMVSDVLGNKAPTTLRKRLRSLLKYETFLVKESKGFPATEIFLYKFLCLERDGGASMSSRKATFEAVVFCRFVLGVEELDLTVKSRRCLGNSCHGEINPKFQASPFTVAELGVLHERLESAADAWDRVFSGSVLLCTYSRARWSDLMHAERIIYDYDAAQNLAFIECPVAYHKTMRSSVMRHDLLPMVAPGMGVAGSNWARLWKLARQELGLGDPPDFPIMPAPDKEGAPTVRPLDTEEMGRWLRCLLFGSSEKQSDRKVTSHSCKCTMLSYAAKWGVSVADRQLLGYHSTPYRMALTYSRDAAAQPLMVLERLIAAIRQGKFRPDETRSGRLLEGGLDGHQPDSAVVLVKDEDPEGEAPTGGVEGLDAAGVTAENDSDIDGHITTDSSSSDSAPEKGEGPFRSLLVNPPENHDIWRHEKSRIVHYTPAGYTKVFCCGRSIGPLHVKIRAEDLRWDFSKCRICNKSVST